jgi:hypothetical protein
MPMDTTAPARCGGLGDERELMATPAENLAGAKAILFSRTYGADEAGIQPSPVAPADRLPR